MIQVIPKEIIQLGQRELTFVIPPDDSILVLRGIELYLRERNFRIITNGQRCVNIGAGHFYYLNETGVQHYIRYEILRAQDFFWVLKSSQTDEFIEPVSSLLL